MAEGRKEEEVCIQHDVVVYRRSALFGSSFLDVDVRSVVSDLSSLQAHFMTSDQLMDTDCRTGKKSSH